MYDNVYNAYVKFIGKRKAISREVFAFNTCTERNTYIDGTYDIDLNDIFRSVYQGTFTSAIQDYIYDKRSLYKCKIKVMRHRVYIHIQDKKLVNAMRENLYISESNNFKIIIGIPCSIYGIYPDTVNDNTLFIERVGLDNIEDYLKVIDLIKVRFSAEVSYDNEVLEELNTQYYEVSSRFHRMQEYISPECRM
jgi:hypothetical protein